MIEQLGICYDSYGKQGMTHDETQLLGLLQSGRDNARSVRFLAGMLNISDVELRQRVRHLIIEHDVLICSSTKRPCGYYYPTTAEEQADGTAQIEHRIIELAKRLRKMNKLAYERIFGQARLEALYK